MPTSDLEKLSKLETYIAAIVYSMIYLWQNKYTINILDNYIQVLHFLLQYEQALLPASLNASSYDQILTHSSLPWVWHNNKMNYLLWKQYKIEFATRGNA